MARPRAVVVAILAAASLGGWWLGAQRRTATAEYTVVAVTDGDTIEVVDASGDRDVVRLLGVDTPETKHPTEPVGCFGPEAAAYTAERLTGRSVRLEGDVESRDRYDRRLAYVMLGGERFNDELLRLGYAELLVIEPNHAHARAMLQAELDAKRAGRGLWGAC
ncbi:MAG TPA: thermonuclease family protein [Acidimicrobiia bacterium]|nr:thermonuclease family protein [Acidimicrobiia bacterium]